MPLILLATQRHIYFLPPTHQRTYVTLLALLQLTLVLAFS
ncbi:hypothetical protein, partial [Pantoea vagans]